MSNIDKPTVLIVHASPGYGQMFTNKGWLITNNVEDADLMLFTGGEDVSPSLYFEEPHPTTRFNTQRDSREGVMYDLAVEMGIPMAGICRGGQFLNVKNGGRMYQDVNGHGGSHTAYDLLTHEHVKVTSTHHQMMRPSNVNDVVQLMVARQSTRREYMRNGTKVAEIGSDAPLSDDIEALFYPDTTCLCFQPHPEFNDGSECREIFWKYLDTFVMPELTYTQAKETLTTKIN